MPRAKRKRAVSSDKKAADDDVDISKLTVAKLKVQLKKYDLDQKGRKADLVTRLQTHLNTINKAEPNKEPEEPPKPKKAKKSPKKKVAASPKKKSAAISKKSKKPTPKKVVEKEEVVEQEIAAPPSSKPKAKPKAKAIKASKASKKPPPAKTKPTPPPPQPILLPPPSPEKPAPGPGQPRENKNQRKRRLKKNAKKRQRFAEIAAAAASSSSSASSSTAETLNPANADYVPEETTVDMADDAMLIHFQNVFQKFAQPTEEELKAAAALAAGNNGAASDGEEDDMDMDDDEYQPVPSKLSNRRKKEQSRLTVAQLKQLVAHPDVVEDHDVTAPDSRLLVHLKSLKGTVPVPRHWSQKRKYLQGKAGHEKSPYELPESIKNTGIDKVREAIAEEEDEKSTKQRQRERTRPKMGKINVDYQELYDAFFVHMKRPSFSGHGDVYYEGKEDEFGTGGDGSGRSKFIPGILSAQLKEALGMSITTTGRNGATLTPPAPWLFNMQRYGPPPSYPRQKISGLNAPIPVGAEFGYHTGGWGKPPVDESGRSIYGDDVFEQEINKGNEWKKFDRTKWGELQPDMEVDDDEEEDEEEDSNEVKNNNEKDQNDQDDSQEMEIEEEEEEDDEDDDMEVDGGTFDVGKAALLEPPKQLYTVLKTQKVSDSSSTNFVGSSHTYTGLGGTNTETSSSSSSSSDTKATTTTANNDEDDDEEDDNAFKF